MSAEKSRPRPGEGLPDRIKIAEGRALHALWKSRAKRSQAEFAAEHGYTQGVVSQFFAGIRPLNLEKARQFARELHVDIREFSPRLADELYEVRDGGPRWPFQRIDPARLARLTPGQRHIIEAEIEGRIMDFEAERKPQR